MAVQSSRLSPYVINETEYQELVAFTRTPGFRARRDRVSEFFRADKTNEAALQVLKVGGSTTLGLTVGGAIIGGCCAGPKGAAIGAAIGFGGGVVFSVAYGYKEMRGNYKDWIRTVEDKGLIDRFKALHKDYVDLEPFICPMSLDIIQDPVHPPCGHTFERKTIERWHDEEIQRDHVPTCPTCRDKFTKDQLSTDITLLGKVKRAYADVARKELENPIYEPEIRKAFEALSADLDIQTVEVLKQVSADLALKLNQEKITPQAFSRMIREVTELYTVKD